MRSAGRLAKPRPRQQPPAPISADELWALWKSIRQILSMWRMPADSMFSRAVWSLNGTDYVWGLRHEVSSRRIFDLMKPLSSRDARRLMAIARLNQRRQDAISRWSAIGFVTLPLSLGLALAQLQPELFRRFSQDWDRATFGSLFIVGLVVIYLLACAWRARQIASVIELGLIEHDVPFDGEAGADEGPPLATEL